MVIAADPVPDGARGLRAPIRKQDRGNPFAAAGTTTLTTSDVFDYALARHRQDQWRRRHRWSVVRVLDQVADRVGRDRRHGAIIGRLKTPAAVPCPPRQIEIIGDGDMVNPAHIADHWLEL